MREVVPALGERLVVMVDQGLAEPAAYGTSESLTHPER